MSLWDQIFHPGRAYKSAGKEITKGYNQGQGYLNPYNQAGNDQIQKLMEAQNRLMNPGGLQDEWAKNYQISPYAKQLQDQAKAGGMDAASSQGLLGSSTATNAIQQGSSNIMNADRQQYMNDMMQKYLAGLGLGTNMFNTGANTAGQMSNNANQYGQNMAGVKFGEGNAFMNQLMNFAKIYEAFSGGSNGGGK